MDESNPLIDGHAYHGAVDQTKLMTLAQLNEAGGKISRVRILSDYFPGRGRMCDISYVHGALPDGTIVPINVTGDINGIALKELKKALIEWADREGVNAKALGLLDEGNWSHLR